MAVAGLAFVLVGGCGGTTIPGARQPLAVHSAAPPCGTTEPPEPLLGSTLSFGMGFVSPALGWYLSFAPSAQQFSLYRTDDGARHWAKQLQGSSSFSRSAEQRPWLQFLDDTHGFISAGSPARLYRTVDGGLHWINVALPDARQYSLTFSDPNHGWDLVNYSQGHGYSALALFATSDGGETWLQLPSPPSDTINIVFRTPSDGWAGSAGATATESESPGPSYIYGTRDGGRTWQRDLLGVLTPGSPRPGALVCLLPSAGLIVPAQDSVLVSSDNGFSWRSRALPIQLSAAPASGGELALVDQTHWWTITPGANATLRKSSDSGATWVVVASNLPWITGLEVIDAEHAWGYVQITKPISTKLEQSADGGLTWSSEGVAQPS